MRPVLIINERLRGDLVVVIPMTTKYKEHADKYYHKIESSSLYGLNQDSYCMLDQIKVISKKRLIRKLNDYENGNSTNISLLEEDIFMEIVNKIHSFI